MCKAQLNTSGNTGVLHMLLHYANAKKVSNRKISCFRQKMILYVVRRNAALTKMAAK